MHIFDEIYFVYNLVKIDKTTNRTTHIPHLNNMNTFSVLDLENLPKMIRTKLYNCLPLFKELRTLILGSGSGGWVTDVYAEKFAVGLPYMKNLG